MEINNNDSLEIPVEIPLEVDSTSATENTEHNEHDEHDEHNEHDEHDEHNEHDEHTEHNDSSKSSKSSKSSEKSSSECSEITSESDGTESIESVESTETTETEATEATEATKENTMINSSLQHTESSKTEKTLEEVEQELFQESSISIQHENQRQQRVVFSLTCHLQNYQYLNNTLECLVKFDIDNIYLNVDLETYHRIKHNNFDTKVKVNPCRNWGPILKLLPTLQLETDPNTIIILVEVGYIYPPNMVSHMINLYEPFFKKNSKPSAYSATLYKLKSVSYFQKVIVHNNVGDIYESHEGTVFLRTFFRSDFTSYISHLIKDEACRYSEDLMISNYLYKYKIPIKCCLRKWYHSNLVFPYLKKTRLYMNSGVHFPIVYKFHRSVEYMSQNKMLYLRNSHAILESLRSLVKRPSHIPFS